jgi:carboxypeptidase C (cathepsin A)
MAFTNAARVVALLVCMVHHAASLRLVTPQNKGDLVTRMPDYPFPIEHYAGHIVVGSKQTTRIFYYFVPAQNAPAQAPLIVWMQNSMTCSSMLGLVYEHGPFRLRSGGSAKVQVVANPHSWHRIANVLYVDIPGGECCFTDVGS